MLKDWRHCKILAGKTIKLTDAEGRLVLADELTLLKKNINLNLLLI